VPVSVGTCVRAGRAVSRPVVHRAAAGPSPVVGRHPQYRVRWQIFVLLGQILSFLLESLPVVMSPVPGPAVIHTSPAPEQAQIQPSVDRRCRGCTQHQRGETGVQAPAIAPRTVRTEPLGGNAWWDQIGSVGFASSPPAVYRERRPTHSDPVQPATPNLCKGSHHRNPWTVRTSKPHDQDGHAVDRHGDGHDVGTLERLR